jgi:hypothetical protein
MLCTTVADTDKQRSTAQRRAPKRCSMARCGRAARFARLDISRLDVAPSGGHTQRRTRLGVGACRGAEARDVPPLPEGLRELTNDGAAAGEVSSASASYRAPVRHVANPNPEEPDAGIPHVRICEGAGGLLSRSGLQGSDEDSDSLVGRLNRPSGSASDLRHRRSAPDSGSASVIRLRQRPPLRAAGGDHIFTHMVILP